MRPRIHHRLAGAALFALALAPACVSGGGTTAPDETFRVFAPGGRYDVVLGVVPAGVFRFEARGFPPVELPPGCDATPVFFTLYDGVPEPTASLFTYQLMQGRESGGCTGIAARGYRPEYPGNVFQAECAAFAWEPARWYEFEVAWGGGTIRTSVDGTQVFAGSYFANEAPLIAALGWPPRTACGSTGAVGLEYRRWELEAQ
jgi:hypothetical protein